MCEKFQGTELLWRRKNKQPNWHKIPDESERVEQELANNYNKQLERNIFHFILISLNSLLQKVNN